MSDSKSPCADCGTDTSGVMRDWYVVTAKIWNEYGLGGCEMVTIDGQTGWKTTTKEGEGFLCIPCLEKRMGRKAVLSDFMPDVPCNEWNPTFQALKYELEKS